MKVKWIDGKRSPQRPPNPSYPKGIDLDVSKGSEKTCTVPLPYPAKRIGSYVVECPVCGAKTACTWPTSTRDRQERALWMPEAEWREALRLALRHWRKR